MLAKIIKRSYYIALIDGKEYPLYIDNEIATEFCETNQTIDGDIIVEEEQDKYDDGSFARSYTIIEKFVPKKNN